MIGQPAPEFTLPAVHREGEISLADYRGKSHLLLAIFVGLYCPFCRRNIAQLGGTQEKLRELGVETLGVVATDLENARLYFKYRPARVPLVADPELSTHRAYALPRVPVTEELMGMLGSVRVNPTGELPEPVPLSEVGNVLDRADGFSRTPADLRDIDRQWPQLKGQFLIDREGIVRWANVECGTEGIAGVGKFPSNEELLAAAGTIG
jgi:peroxiredoxin